MSHKRRNEDDHEDRRRESRHRDDRDDRDRDRHRDRDSRDDRHRDRDSRDDRDRHRDERREDRHDDRKRSRDSRDDSRSHRTDESDAKQKVEERAQALLEQNAQHLASSASAPPTPSAPGSTPGIRAATPLAPSLNISALQASVQARLEAMKKERAEAMAAKPKRRSFNDDSSVGPQRPGERSRDSSSRSRPGVILTAEGRIVDSTGKEVTIGLPVAELKVNIRANEVRVPHHFCVCVCVCV